MVGEHHKEVQKASNPKGVESPINDATRDESENESFSDSEGLNYGRFTKEETKALRSMINKQLGKAIKNVTPFYISQTTDNLKEVIRKELEELKKGGMMNDSRNEMETYRDFTACDVPKFDGTLDPIACTQCLSAGEEWIGTCTWKEFKEMFTTEYAPVEEVDKIQKEFQTLTQTNETVNEIWKKFNDLIPYCPEYHGNENLKVEKFQRMLRDDIREFEMLRSLNKIKAEEVVELKSRNHARSVIKLILDKNLSTPPNKLPFLEVEIAGNEIVVVSKVYRDVEIETDDSVFKIDLIPIVLGAFYIVIGMDWLDRYNANNLCSQKLVRVVNPLGREIIIYEEKRKGEFKLCSMMKARKYLSHGYQAFMAHVIDTRCEKKSVKDISVVNEFFNVFPGDMPGISPERQVEF
nr:hypothetical protein [Tanacetum cinerariifolium]